ncbi:MAG: N-acetylglucosaminyl-diphospho-decaprenol L-rhamnosyltransferase [bacterium ADurb.Bin363]|nr:MAG: N-acetylglucosaminyl-diphospho-decaprenol L-rhamnosyltransferase [bacterium ADurb.Bin363]
MSYLNESIKLSIVIPLYNGRDHISTCLKSLELALSDLSYEIIIVDNGSTDGGIELIKQSFPCVKVICNKENRYFARANNQGFAIASGNFIVTLNSDTEIIESPFEFLMEFMEKNLDTGITSCPLYFLDERLQPTRRRRKTWKAFLLEFTPFYLFLRIKSMENYLKKLYYENDKGLPAGPQDVEVLQGALLMIKKETLSFLGGFDETFRLSFTDDELCIRCGRLGYRVVFIPEGKVLHHERVSQNRVSLVEFIHWSDYFYYIRKYMGGWPSLFFFYPLYILGRFFRWVFIKFGIIDHLRRKKSDFIDN